RLPLSSFRRTGCFMRAVGSARQRVAFEVAAAPAAPGRDRNKVLLADLEPEPARHLGRAGKERSDQPPIPFVGDDALAHRALALRTLRWSSHLELLRQAPATADFTIVDFENKVRFG